MQRSAMGSRRRSLSIPSPLMDTLKIEKAILAGFDWGARTANIIAALWPERCKAMVSVSGYLIGSQESGKIPLPPKAELEWWYQYYFATERGRAGYEKYTHDFAKLIWQIASPKWQFDDATSSAPRRHLRIRITSARHWHLPRACW
jgi:pimeloyl-ACP methyl ester carboxylesterase